MILITGACGFIGSHFCKLAVSDLDEQIIVLDKLTYAANRDYIKDLPVLFHNVDIANANDVKDIFNSHNISSIINFAAESHVDRSIDDCMPFVNSNIIGTINLLQMAVKHKIKNFLQISTDEVFGSVPYPFKFSELSPINPRNPYSASKASAEHFVSAFANTYGIKTSIVNCSNNYGPHQYHEKMIPLTIKKIINGEKIPVYGDGLQIRDWVYVEDSVRAMMAVFKNGKSGVRYCIGGNDIISNLELVEILLDKLNASVDLIEFVKDRPGHDKRYATKWDKIYNDLDWKPIVSISEGLDKTIDWIKNENRI